MWLLLLKLIFWRDGENGGGFGGILLGLKASKRYSFCFGTVVVGTKLYRCELIHSWWTA